MQQFYFTYCSVSMSVTGRGGWQIRALSPGLSEASVRPLLPCADYQKPSARISPSAAPRRLALLVAQSGNPDTQRVLVHSVFIGTEAGRLQDNFFSHVISDLPATIGALDAILAWGSRSWRTDNYEGVCPLPEVSTLPGEGTLNPSLAQQFLREPALRPVVEGCIQACLQALITPQPQRQIYIAGDSESIAKIIYAIALCLPVAHQRQLTFSTYEKNPIEVRATIVGTFFADLKGGTLPAKCSSGGNFSVNLFDRVLTLPPPGEYARGVVSLLARGENKALELLRQAADAMEFQTTEDLNFLARVLEDPGQIGEADLLRALSYAKLAEWFCEHDPHHALVVRVVNLLVGLDKVSREPFRVAIDILAKRASSPLTLQALREEALHRAAEEARNGADEPAVFLVSEFLCWIGESAIKRNWSRLLKIMLKDEGLYTSVPVRIRVLLLVNAADVDWGGSVHNFSNLRQRWLDVCIKEIEPILCSRLADEDKTAAVEACFRHLQDKQVPPLIRQFLVEKSSQGILRSLLKKSLTRAGGLFLADLVQLWHAGGFGMSILLGDLSEIQDVPKENAEILIATLDSLNFKPAALAELVQRLFDPAYCLHSHFEAASAASAIGVFLSHFVKQIQVEQRPVAGLLSTLKKLAECSSQLPSEDRRRAKDLATLQELFTSHEASVHVVLKDVCESWNNLKDSQGPDIRKQIIRVLAHATDSEQWRDLVNNLGECLSVTRQQFIDEISQIIVETQSPPLDPSLVCELIYSYAVECSKEVPSSGRFIPKAISRHLNSSSNVFSDVFSRMAKMHPDSDASLLSDLLVSVPLGQAYGFVSHNLDVLLAFENLAQSVKAVSLFQEYIQHFPVDCKRILESFDNFVKLRTTLLHVMDVGPGERLSRLLQLGEFLRTGTIENQEAFGGVLSYFYESVEPFMSSLEREQTIGVQRATFLIRIALMEATTRSESDASGIYERTAKRILVKWGEQASSRLHAAVSKELERPESSHLKLLLWQKWTQKSTTPLRLKHPLQQSSDYSGVRQSSPRQQAEAPTIKSGSRWLDVLMLVLVLIGVVLLVWLSLKALEMVTQPMSMGHAR